MTIPAVLLLLLLTSGCAVGGSEPKLALRVDHDAAATAELERAGANLAGAVTLSLTTDAFRRQSELVVDRRPLRTLKGHTDGLRLTPPVRLRLERINDTCRLQRPDTGATSPLTLVRCKAL